MAQIIPFRRPDRVRQTLPIPVTVVMGLSGSGKSELIRSLVSQSPGLHIGVLDDPQMTSEEGGCSDCGTRQDLLQAIKACLLSEPQTDILIIEAAEDCDPQVIVDTFSLLEEDEPSLAGRIILDTLVCVVAASRFWQDYSREPQKMDGLDAVELMVEHLELCDVMILNQDSAGDELQSSEIESILRTLQPRARWIQTSDFKFSSSAVLGTGLYDEQETLEGAAWKQAVLQGVTNFRRIPVSSMVYKRFRPFHPERLAQLIEHWPENILRSYGQIWLASRKDIAINISQIGPATLHFTPEGFWSERYSVDQPTEFSDPDPERYTEIAFVGREIHAEEWIAELDQCLLTDEEMKADWNLLSDPFPQWLDFLALEAQRSSATTGTRSGYERSYLKLVIPPPGWVPGEVPSPSVPSPVV